MLSRSDQLVVVDSVRIGATIFLKILIIDQATSMFQFNLCSMIHNFYFKKSGCHFMAIPVAMDEEYNPNEMFLLWKR
jgi:hypothetical protein